MPATPRCRKPIAGSLSRRLGGILALSTASVAGADDTCKLVDLAGRYVGLDNGYVVERGRTTPTARLFVENWTRDGKVNGTAWLRRGQQFREMSYTGSWQVNPDCTGLVDRKTPIGGWRSSLVISPVSHEAYSIDLASGSVIAGTLAPQPVGACSNETLKGVVKSTQTGFSYRKGGWQPNAVIQREEHDGKGKLVGLAVSSYAGGPQYGRYTGTFDLKPDCTGSLLEIDTRGERFDYRVVVAGPGKGYYYLQTDPNDLTGAYLGASP